ncbi:MAG: family 43 glycosylhydrolase, partial [Myxococcales bacterium]|nr:family 43 glycosylhydrolase [Myxococcales bacterium]
YYLFYERIWSFTDSEILARSSTDLVDWSPPTVVLAPSLPWETGAQHTTGNPFVMKRDGAYWLYYSADGVFLPDTGFYEPKFIGLARANAPLGPYTKEPEPILGPDWREPYRNYGAGSMKLLDEQIEGRWIALNNGIAFDFEGRTRSAIQVLSSEDGIHWETLCPAPILAPTDEGWKTSFVYAFDTARAGDTIRVYFNARQGWRRGTERIGLATLTLPR